MSWSDVMAWLLIVTGTILIILPLYLKYTVYKPEKNKFSNQDDQIMSLTKSKNNRQKTQNLDFTKDKEVEQQRDQLEEINYNLEDLIKQIARKERKLEENINTILSSVNQLENQAGKTDKVHFKNVINRHYKKLETDILPEKYSNVFKLKRNGKNAKEIAKELDLGIRETELILKVYQRKADKYVQ